MSPSTFRAFGAAALVSGVAGLALATPAAAMVDPAPPPASDVGYRHTQHGGTVTQTPTAPTTVTGEDSPWPEIGVAALGGLAIAGVAIGASVAVRRRGVVDTA